MSTESDGSAERLARLFRKFSRLDKKGELGEAIAEPVESVSIYDLAMVCGGIDRGLRDIPGAYRKSLRPYLHVRLFDDRRRILAMRADGSFRKMDGDIRDKASFTGYCELIAGAHGDIYDSGPALMHYMIAGATLYTLTTCFAMFVMDEPGHPVGMPFPGGFTIHVRDSVYYCPVKEKEKGVKNAFCNFCPARQADIGGDTGATSPGR